MCFFHLNSDSSFLGKTSQIHLSSRLKQVCVRVVTGAYSTLQGLEGRPGMCKGTWVRSLIPYLLG